MDEIKKIKSRVISHQRYSYVEKGEKLYDSVILLENQRVIEIYGKKPLNFDYLDEVEFFGRDVGNYFYVFSFKILNKYKRRKNPIKLQKKISDFEIAIKKQESKQDG